MPSTAQASAQELERTAIAALDAIKSESELEEWRVAYLGRRGEVSARLRNVGSLPPEERREAGANLNRLKSKLTNAFDEAMQTFAGGPGVLPRPTKSISHCRAVDPI